jgi:hypothetical protein
VQHFTPTWVSMEIVSIFLFATIATPEEPFQTVVTNATDHQANSRGREGLDGPIAA